MSVFRDFITVMHKNKTVSMRQRYSEKLTVGTTLLDRLKLKIGFPQMFSQKFCISFCIFSLNAFQ